MNEKKQRMIEVGMKLFAQNGFHATSIQEIAQSSGVSKGAFYLHFKSKEDLILSIYKFYYESTKEKVIAAKEGGLPPKEQLSLQLQIYFGDFLKQKDFMIMQFRENFSINDQLDQFILKMRREIMRWFESAITAIYKEKVSGYEVDIAMLLEGIVTSYLKVVLFDPVQLDFKKVADYIVERVDDCVVGITARKANPMLTKEMLPTIYQDHVEETSNVSVDQWLQEAIHKVDQLELSRERKEELQATIQVLMVENAKEQPQKVVFKGMLMTFQDIAELQEIKHSIMKELNIV